MRTVLKVAGVGCLTVLVAAAILVAVNWDRITLVARNFGAVFDGAEAAQSQGRRAGRRESDGAGRAWRSGSEAVSATARVPRMADGE